MCPNLSFPFLFCHIPCVRVCPPPCAVPLMSVVVPRFFCVPLMPLRGLSVFYYHLPTQHPSPVPLSLFGLFCGCLCSGVCLSAPLSTSKPVAFKDVSKRAIMRLGDPASLGIMYTYGVPLYFRYMGIAWHPVAASAKAVFATRLSRALPRSLLPSLKRSVR